MERECLHSITANYEGKSSVALHLNLPFSVLSVPITDTVQKVPTVTKNAVHACGKLLKSREESSFATAGDGPPIPTCENHLIDALASFNDYRCLANFLR